MLAPLLNHLWQSTAFAAVAGLLTLALRKNRARIRYWLWFTASVKFLVPFSMLAAIGAQFGAVRPVAVETRISYGIEQVSQPFTPAAVSMLPAAPLPAVSLSAVLLAIWILGCAAVLIRRLAQWRSVRAAVRAASPLTLDIGVRTLFSPILLEPGVFGIVRPVPLLPEGIADHLDAAQLQAIVAHELCHIRRRDNLLTAVHMAVEAIFWFHPLVWWIGARLVEERERACDEDVLCLGNDPEVYAESILRACRFYLELPLPCVSGVTGGGLKRRIEQIMTHRIGGHLDFGRKLLLAGAGIAALSIPLAVGIMNAPPIRAQSSPAAAGRPKFEVASIKTCQGGDVSGGRGPKGGGAGASSHSSPVTFNLPCSTVRFYLQLAYIVSDAMLHDGSSAARLEGGPGWIDSARYQIAAKPDGPASKEMMNGPMLQSLLEERFHLKFHRETRDMPAYALTVAAKGLKLRPADGSSCAPRDPDPSVPPGEKPWCGLLRSRRSAQRVTMDLPGATMAQLARGLWMPGDYQVIDRTALQEKFDFHLEYATDEARPSDDALPSVFTEVGRLGLKLEPVKAPREFMVIDHIERPSEN